MPSLQTCPEYRSQSVPLLWELYSENWELHFENSPERAPVWKLRSENSTSTTLFWGLLWKIYSLNSTLRTLSKELYPENSSLKTLLREFYFSVEKTVLSEMYLENSILSGLPRGLYFYNTAQKTLFWEVYLRLHWNFYKPQAYISKLHPEDSENMFYKNIYRTTVWVQHTKTLLRNNRFQICSSNKSHWTFRRRSKYV